MGRTAILTTGQPTRGTNSIRVQLVVAEADKEVLRGRLGRPVGFVSAEERPELEGSRTMPQLWRVGLLGQEVSYKEQTEFSQRERTSEWRQRFITDVVGAAASPSH